MFVLVLINWQYKGVYRLQTMGAGVVHFEGEHPLDWIMLAKKQGALCLYSLK